MIFTPNDLQAFLAVCKSKISAINYVRAIIDDSMLANDLDRISPADNLLLYGVLPDYVGDGRTEDALMMNNGLDFLVLRKVQYSDITSQEFLDVMQETLLAARELVLLTHSEQSGQGGCPQFYFLEMGTEQIVPVWGKAGCNGYMISFNLRTTF